MILRTPRGRSGITLTEILISILIMGVGMVSLATLFPLGLLRLRDATRMSRSATLTESATGDHETRDLLNKSSFLNANYAPWYSTSTAFYTPAATPWGYDPWIQDTPSYRGDPIVGPEFGAYRGNGSFNSNFPTPHNKSAPLFIPGPGLPVAYDPLWRQQTQLYPGVTGHPEARFASGIGYVRPDPDGGDPSAHGLQRITNFSPYRAFGGGPYGTMNADGTINTGPANPASNAVPAIFVSPDDMVFQSDKDKGTGAGMLSPVVPDLVLDNSLNLKIPLNDFKYTWMFTGQQADCTNGTVFTGDIVVFENRPFAVDAVKPPFSDDPISVVAGETVVEAIFGYTGKVTTNPATPKAVRGYGSTANRAVLLRWPASMPDPEVKVGSWIADVTYERKASTDLTRRYTDADNGINGGAGAYYPYQRCHWYQIAKRTQPGPGQAFAGDPPVADITYREMTVWVNTPLRALTLLSKSTTPVGSPVHVNAALVSPYVVNVFPRTFYSR